MGGGVAFYKQFNKIVNSNNNTDCIHKNFIKFKINNILAFSLIELSIVLIIIGLLVAGVTGGASLIESAKQQSFITELRNWDLVVNAFYATKGRLPSDVDNDGRFGGYSNDNYNDYFPAPYNGTEYAVPNSFTAPFVDLYLNGIIEFKPEYTTTNQLDGLPTSTALKNDSFYHFVDLSNNGATDDYIKDIKNHILMLNFLNSKQKYKVKFIERIDNKMDDKNPSSGKFRAKFNDEKEFYDDYITPPSNTEIKYIVYDITQ